MRYPQEMLPSIAPPPVPNAHLACTQTHTQTLTHSSEGCHVYPGVWLCCSTLQMSQRQKSVFWPESLQAACVFCRATFVSTIVCVSVHLCTYACVCFYVYLRLLIPRGWGWEKQVRKQQNKLRDNEESNTGTCFPLVWRVKNPPQKPFKLCSFDASATNDIADNVISRHFSPPFFPSFLAISPSN